MLNHNKIGIFVEAQPFSSQQLHFSEEITLRPTAPAVEIIFPPLAIIRLKAILLS